MRYQVTVYVNVDRECFFGYKPKHPIAEVDTFTFDTDGSPESAAEGMFHVGNKMGPDANGKMYPHDVRSVSVGDLLKIVDSDGRQKFLAVASVGWTEVPEPTNPIVALEGTWATSRLAKEV